jgi:predicted DCC family thiol-disulfide oxidoreductase YuxK
VTTLLFDGDCGFCTRSVAVIPRLRLRVDEIVPYQVTDVARFGLTPEVCAGSLQWVADDGTVAAGHRAVARLMLNSGLVWRSLGWALLSPALSGLAAALYRFVAANRMRLPGGTPACSAPPLANPDLPR